MAGLQTSSAAMRVSNTPVALSLTVMTSRSTREFDVFTRRAAEGFASPLGFATIGEPRTSPNSNQEWFEYDIRGNRLTDHRRILYRAIRNGNTLMEIVFESSEDRFDILLPEALSIASSLKSVPRKVRVRQYAGFCWVAGGR